MPMRDHEKQFGPVVAVMTRKAVEFWWGTRGYETPPELHSVHLDPAHRHRIVTWAEVMDARRERQRRRLDLIRTTNQVRAYKLWVAYFDQSLMGGWQAMIEDWRGRSHHVWIDRDRRRLVPELLRLFPLVPDSGTEREQWQEWKPAFAKAFKRRRHHGRSLGVAYLWWDGDSAISRVTA